MGAALAALRREDALTGCGLSPGSGAVRDLPMPRLFVTASRRSRREAKRPYRVELSWNARRNRPAPVLPWMLCRMTMHLAARS
jgi:hypothetical protein